MKLRNKETGETGYLELEKGDDEKYIGLRVYKNDFVYKRYGSIIDLSAEWEDYKPKTNSRFLLVKDLPTFKAGQVFHLSPKGNLVLDDGFGICAYSKQTLEKFPNILEDWFEPINDDKNAIDIDKVNELIDKIHPEPRIENEEVRKAVRVWAEACGVRTVVFYLFGVESEFWNNDNNNVSISFNFPLKLEDGRVYTIDELCGEEEDA